MCSLMNAPMRMRAVLLDLRRDVDEHEAAGDRRRRCVPMARIDAMPPSDAPTSTGGCGQRGRDRGDVAGERVGPVVAVVGPVALAVAAQVDAAARASPRSASTRAVGPHA